MVGHVRPPPPPETNPSAPDVNGYNLYPPRAPPRLGRPSTPPPPTASSPPTGPAARTARDRRRHTRQHRQQQDDREDRPAHHADRPNPLMPDLRDRLSIYPTPTGAPSASPWRASSSASALILLATARAVDRSNALTNAFAGGIVLLLVSLGALWDSRVLRRPRPRPGSATQPVADGVGLAEPTRRLAWRLHVSSHSTASPGTASRRCESEMPTDRAAGGPARQGDHRPPRSPTAEKSLVIIFFDSEDDYRARRRGPQRHADRRHAGAARVRDESTTSPRG